MLILAPLQRRTLYEHLQSLCDLNSRSAGAEILPHLHLQDPHTPLTRRSSQEKDHHRAEQCFQGSVPAKP